MATYTLSKKEYLEACKKSQGRFTLILLGFILGYLAVFSIGVWGSVIPDPAWGKVVVLNIVWLGAPVGGLLTVFAPLAFRDERIIRAYNRDYDSDDLIEVKISDDGIQSVSRISIDWSEVGKWYENQDFVVLFRSKGSSPFVVKKAGLSDAELSKLKSRLKKPKPFPIWRSLGILLCFFLSLSIVSIFYRPGYEETKIHPLVLEMGDEPGIVWTSLIQDGGSRRIRSISKEGKLGYVYLPNGFCEPKLRGRIFTYDESSGEEIEVSEASYPDTRAFLFSLIKDHGTRHDHNSIDVQFYLLPKSRSVRLLLWWKKFMAECTGYFGEDLEVVLEEHIKVRRNYLETMEREDG